MKHIKTKHIEFFVLEEGESALLSTETRNDLVPVELWITNAFGEVIDTLHAGHSKLSDLTEEQAMDIAPKYEIDDNGTPFTWYGDADFNLEFADDWVKWAVNQALKDNGGLRMGGHRTQVECSFRGDKRQYVETAKTNAIPPEQIIIKL